MSWVRGHSSGRTGNQLEQSKEGSVEETGGNASNPTSTIETSDKNQIPTAPTLVKRGSHKLILKKDRLLATEQAIEMDQSSKKLAGHQEKESRLTASDHGEKMMKKVGRNKLVLKDEVNDKVSVLDNAGKGNLELARHPASTVHPTLDQSKKRRRPGQFHGHRPAAQRIRLMNTGAKVEQPDENAAAYSNASPEATTEGHERLSDFAYRETGRTVQRFQHRTWKAGETSSPDGNDGPRRMGLVRAKDSKAPICPTYVKGIECTDKFCRKRHDVPKESAVPVCSFFQRNGQCLKEDCKFRHIKINPRATVCPSFALLGYCEDSECVMKHSRAPPKEIDNNRKIPPPSNRKYVRQA